MNTNPLVVLAVFGVIALGSYTLTLQTEPGPQGPEGPRGEQGPAGHDGKNGKDGITYGSVTASDALSSPVCVDGVCTYTTRQVMSVATSTVCNIKSPAATSTYSYAWNITTATGTAAILRLATSTRMNATTTSVAYWAVDASTKTQRAFIASSTAESDGGSRILGPNTWLVLGAEGAPAPGFTFGGRCTATFQII